MAAIDLPGAEHLHTLIDIIAGNPTATTARLLEYFRDTDVHGYLEKLAAYPTSVEDSVRQKHFDDVLMTLINRQQEQRRLALLEKSRQQGLDDAEKAELVALLATRKGPAGQAVED